MSWLDARSVGNAEALMMQDPHGGVPQPVVVLSQTNSTFTVLAHDDVNVDPKTLSIAVVLFTLMVVRNSRQDLLDQTVSQTAQLSEVIMKSMRFAMQHDEPDALDQIIADVGGLKVAQDSNPQRRAGNFAFGNNRASMGWILEDNDGMRNIIETIGGQAYKRYRIYEKNL